MVMPHPHIHDFGDLPEVDEEPHEDAELHHEVGLVVPYVQQHHQRLEDPEEHRTHRKALQGLTAVPELNVCFLGGGGGEKKNQPPPIFSFPLQSFPNFPPGKGDG